MGLEVEITVGSMGVGTTSKVTTNTGLKQQTKTNRRSPEEARAIAQPRLSSLIKLGFLDTRSSFTVRKTRTISQMKLVKSRKCLV